MKGPPEPLDHLPHEASPLTPPSSPKPSQQNVREPSTAPTSRYGAIPIAQSPPSTFEHSPSPAPQRPAPTSPRPPSQRSPLSWASLSPIPSTASSTSEPSDTSVFSHASGSTTRSENPPETFYHGLAEHHLERTRHLHDTGQIYGTRQLGEGRRGGVSAPSGRYYEGKYERGNLEGRPGHGGRGEKGGADSR